MLPPRFIRRLVLAPLVVVIALAFIVLSPFLALLALVFGLAARSRPGRMRSLRLTCFALIWFIAETATLFGLDAWFDVLTAGAGSAWYGSLVEAFFGELPMMIILAAIAVWAPRHCRPASACAPVGRPDSHLDELDAGELAELLPGGGVVTEVHDLVVRSAGRHPAGQAGADS